MLKRLVYLSTATDLLAESELAELLSESRRNNSRDGITGLLLYDEGNFIQALEGDPARLESLMARLAGDPRHRGIKVVESEAVTARIFSEWTMAYAKLGPRAMQAVRDRLTDTASNAEGIAIMMLRVFLRGMRTQ